VKDLALECSGFKRVHRLDISPSGYLALATSHGLAVLHPSWIPKLNRMNVFQAWNLIRVPTETFGAWWDPAWSAEFRDVGFAGDNALFAVKAPHGLWRLELAIDHATMGHRSLATGFFPGVECGMNYTLLLHGWANPDTPTLHHPYGVVADGDTAYVTGWSGKVRRLSSNRGDGVEIRTVTLRDNLARITFTSPFGPCRYEVQHRTDLSRSVWTTRPTSVIEKTGRNSFTAECPISGADSRFYRIRISP
jgi:hypothetical protein